MIRLLYRTKTSSVKAIKDFDLEKVKTQLHTAEEFIMNKLKDLKPESAMEGIIQLLNSRKLTLKY